MDAATRKPAKVRAMPGLCPIPLPRFAGQLHSLPSELDLLCWFFRVREWGLSQESNGRPLFITGDACVAWLGTLIIDYDELAVASETLSSLLLLLEEEKGD